MTEPSFGTTVWTSQTVSPSTVAVHGSTFSLLSPWVRTAIVPFLVAGSP